MFASSPFWLAMGQSITVQCSDRPSRAHGRIEKEAGDIVKRDFQGARVI
jgi:hypothetical protein